MVSPFQEDGHGNAHAANLVQGGRPWRQLMMVSIESQHGENLAATKANTDIDNPDEAIAKGSRLQR
jgi:hypothetical protein